MPIVLSPPEPRDLLKSTWSSSGRVVLPICKDCRADGAIPLARTKRLNGVANAKRTQCDRLIADVPKANVDVVSPL